MAKQRVEGCGSPKLRGQRQNPFLNKKQPCRVGVVTCAYNPTTGEVRQEEPSWLEHKVS